MTEPIPASEVPSDVGRNDPCPCGSGKKYKKCCMRTHRVQKEAQKTSRKPEQLIGERTKPWRMYRLLVQMRENNMPNLFWETSHELGPWRAKYPSKEAYFEALGNGTDSMVARDGYELLRIRHDGPDVLLLLGRTGEQHRATVSCEVVTLRRNEIDAERNPRQPTHWGFRIWNVERHEAEKPEDGEVRFEALGYEWSPEWEHEEQTNLSPAGLAAPLATDVVAPSDEERAAEEE